MADESILERLERTDGQLLRNPPVPIYANPDGPEAAALIRELAGALSLLVEWIDTDGGQLSEEDEARVKATLSKVKPLSVEEANGDRS